MLGKPKFDYNDIVRWTSKWTDENGNKYSETHEGSIAIIDRYGTFFYTEDVSYDIYDRSVNILYKHIPEPLCEFVRKGTEEESLDYLYKDPKRE